LPAASPDAVDWCVSPSQKDEKSSSEYGLATKNDASARTATIAIPRSAPALPPAAVNCATAAATTGSSTIPPVYFVAQARPSPSPAST
jgi:hypothetical protein